MNTFVCRPRILAIDFGTKRLGVAVSDPLGITAQGLPTRERTRLDDDLDYVAKLASEYLVERVVIGNPLGGAGNETPMSGRVATFAEKLRKRLGCPVELWDERLTSAEAGRILRQSGISIEKRRRAADRVSVTLLLQGYLDYQAVQRAGRGHDLNRVERLTTPGEPAIHSASPGYVPVPAETDRSDPAEEAVESRPEVNRTDK
jgi:putative Holliday junction resolvase